MKLSAWVNRSIFIAMVIALIALTVTAIIVRDYDFMVKHPWAFIIEIIFFSAVPSLLIAIVFVKTRRITIKDGIIWFFVMMLKFAIFHILLQLSGVYTVLFEAARYYGIPLETAAEQTSVYKSSYGKV